jgi:hypothetical protein
LAPEAFDPPQHRRRTLEAIKHLLLRESQVQPLCLIFEDLHWIDAETQALLDSLVESLPTARLLLLVNYRPEYQHGWGSKTYYTQLRLDPLPPANADELLQALLGNDPSLASLKQLLIARTQGNPFFLEESVRALVETGILVGERGAYRLTRPLESLQVSATVQAVLAARIDRLPPEEKRLLQTAAVIGTEVPWPLLQAIADAPDEALYRALAHLQAAEFLYETSLFPEPEYTFKHALTHEVAYGSLLLEQRRGLQGAQRSGPAGMGARQYGPGAQDNGRPQRHHYDGPASPRSRGRARRLCLAGASIPEPGDRIRWHRRLWPGGRTPAAPPGSCEQAVWHTQYRRADLSPVPGAPGADLGRAGGLRRGPALRRGGAPPYQAGRPRAHPDHGSRLPRPPVPRPGGPGHAVLL